MLFCERLFLKHSTFFKNKVIIVTGASSGIGKNIALRFSHLGAKVVLAARNEVKLTALKDRINSAGNEAIIVKTDVLIDKNVINAVIKGIPKNKPIVVVPKTLYLLETDLCI